jgi:hypothetical protein
MIVFWRTLVLCLIGILARSMGATVSLSHGCVGDDFIRNCETGMVRITWKEYA